jgi:hypothetical protein
MLNDMKEDRVNSKNIMLGSLLLTVVGCSSAPREVDASIALVANNKSTLLGGKVPFSIEKFLNQSVAKTIVHNGYTVDMSKVYRSALGFNCTNLIFKNKLNGNINKTACQNKMNEIWVFIKSIDATGKQVKL